MLGLEQFGVAHDRGSSHGQTRIIRQAYFEHPDYVPLLQSVYELWRKLEAESGKSLLHLCGLLLVGPSEGEVIAGAELAAHLHGLPLHDISLADARERFPGFRFPEFLGIVHEPRAGYLEVENCVRAHIEAAAQRGAQVSTDEVVQGWDTNGSTVRVRTAKGEYEAASLIVTAGTWASRILSELALPLRVVRKTQFWFPVRSDVYGDGGPEVERPSILKCRSVIFMAFRALTERTERQSRPRSTRRMEKRSSIPRRRTGPCVQKTSDRCIDFWSSVFPSLAPLQFGTASACTLSVRISTSSSIEIRGIRTSPSVPASPDMVSNSPQ